MIIYVRKLRLGRLSTQSDRQTERQTNRQTREIFKLP